MIQRNESGLSLLEVILVTCILAILSVAGIGYYRNAVKSREFLIASKNIISVLKLAQGRAIAGEDQMKWGIHFVNGPAAFDDYYELFSTPTIYSDPSTVVTDKIYLQSTMAFSDPAANTNKDIIFDKIKGTIAAVSSVTTTFEGTSKTVTVNAQGNIY